MPSHTHTFTGNATSSAGAHTHTLNNHTHTYTKANGATEGHKLTIAEMPKHNHQTYMSSAPVNVSTGSGYLIKYLGEPKDRVTDTGGDGSHSHTIKASSANTGSNNGNTSSNGAHTHTISGTNSNSGGNGAHNNMPPYLVVYMWKRTA